MPAERVSLALTAHHCSNSSFVRELLQMSVVIIGIHSRWHHQCVSVMCTRWYQVSVLRFYARLLVSLQGSALDFHGIGGRPVDLLGNLFASCTLITLWNDPRSQGCSGRSLWHRSEGVNVQIWPSDLPHWKGHRSIADGWDIPLDGRAVLHRIGVLGSTEVSK